MTSEEILQDILSKITPRMIIQGASRDNEKPMGYLLTYIRDMYGLPKTQGWDIAEAVLKHYNIENKEYHSIFENKTMKRQKVIKMNESQLRNVIKENINAVLKEGVMTNGKQLPNVYLSVLQSPQRTPEQKKEWLDYFLSQGFAVPQELQTKIEQDVQQHQQQLSSTLPRDVVAYLKSKTHYPEDKLRYINQVVDKKYSRAALQPYIEALQQEIKERDKTPQQRQAEIEAQKRRWGREAQQYFMQNWKDGTWGHMKESQLQRVISENIAKVLNEDFSSERNVWDVLDELKQTMSADDILARLISRIGEYAAIKYLEDIKSVEVPAQDEPDEF